MIIWKEHVMVKRDQGQPVDQVQAPEKGDPVAEATAPEGEGVPAGYDNLHDVPDYSQYRRRPS